MHVVQHPRRQRVQRGMYSPIDRGVVSNARVGNVGGRYVYTGLGEVDGLFNNRLFNIGKMFTRMFTFKPSSFQLKNIAGAVGSVVTTMGTGGLIAFAPKIQSAKSSVSKGVGYGTMAVAAAAGIAYGGYALLGPATGVVGGTTGAALTTAPAIGTAASGSSVIGAATGQVVTSGGFLSTVGSVFSTVGSGLLKGITALGTILPVFSQAMGSGGGGQPQMTQEQSGMTQAEYDAYMAQQAQVQAQYDAQVRAQQQQMYQPTMYNGEQPASMNTSYGDLRTPYTAITEDGEQVQVDPMTGQVIQSGMSTPMLIGIGAVTLLAGWYLFSGSKSIN